jgi:hypothetical protein
VLETRDEVAFTDEELTELALGADTAAPLADDAVPIHEYLAQLPAPLPGWYMPPAIARADKPWRRPVVITIIFAFLLIDAFGLCGTYGQLVFA